MCVKWYKLYMWFWDLGWKLVAFVAKIVDIDLSTLSSFLCVNMHHRKHFLRQYSMDLNQHVIYQAYTLGKRATEIAIDLDISLCDVQQAKQTWNQIGQVCHSKWINGRHLLLTPEQTQVCALYLIACNMLNLSPFVVFFLSKFMLTLIEQSPNIYPDKIQEGLQELHDIEISLSSIWRTLRHLGMSAKKICPILHLFGGHWVIVCHVSSSCMWCLSNVRTKGKHSASTLVNTHPNIVLPQMRLLSISSQHIAQMGGQSEVYMLRKGAVLWEGHGTIHCTHFLQAILTRNRYSMLPAMTMLRKALQLVVHASAWHETLKICPHDSGIAPSCISNAVYECSGLRNVESEQQWLTVLVAMHISTGFATLHSAPSMSVVCLPRVFNGANECRKFGSRNLEWQLAEIYYRTHREIFHYLCKLRPLHSWLLVLSSSWQVLERFPSWNLHYLSTLCQWLADFE